MATLIHEVWAQPDESGQMLPGLCMAGPEGEGFRALIRLEPGARLVCTFTASSHFEAMTKYDEIVGYGEYYCDEPWVHGPYEQAEADRQAGG